MIIGAGGQRYIPYGVSVTGLGNPSWKRHSPGDDAEINATAASWCSNTATTVPAFLSYLARKGMGLTAWTLVPGVLAASTDLANPTVIESDWACTNTGLDEGAGSLIMNWFKQHNS
jgi:hypothetical protein